MRRSRASRSVNPTLNAVVLPAFERARDEARALGPEAKRGDAPVPRRPVPDEGHRWPGSRRAVLHGDEVPEARGLGGARDRRTSPSVCARPASSRSAVPTRPSWRCCRPPSRRHGVRRATRGTRSTARADRAAARRRPSRRAWCRPRTRATAAARSAFRHRTADSSDSRPTRGRTLVRPGCGRALERLLVRAGRLAQRARHRGDPRRRCRRDARRSVRGRAAATTVRAGSRRRSRSIAHRRALRFAA